MKKARRLRLNAASAEKFTHLMKKYVLIVDMIFEKMKPYLLVTELLLGLKVTLLSLKS